MNEQQKFFAHNILIIIMPHSNCCHWRWEWMENHPSTHSAGIMQSSQPAIPSTGWLAGKCAKMDGVPCTTVRLPVHRPPKAVFACCTRGRPISPFPLLPSFLSPAFPISFLAPEFLVDANNNNHSLFVTGCRCLFGHKRQKAEIREGVKILVQKRQNETEA